MSPKVQTIVTGRVLREVRGDRVLTRKIGPVRRRLLRVSLAGKILGLQVATVFLAAVVGAAVAVGVLHAVSLSSAVWLFGGIGLASVLVMAPVQQVVLHFALEPVRVLGRTAMEVESGDLASRVPPSEFADPEVERLTSVFNRLLDSVVADRERLREVAARAFRAQETERARLAHELQDETAQVLATLLLLLRRARRADDAEREQLLSALREELMGVTDAIRHYARRLHPPALEELGLSSALETLAREVEESSGISVSVAAEDIRPVLTSEQELAMYRIIQEALLNAARHARAGAVRIRMTRSGDAVWATVEDDGVGFRVAEVEAERLCLGLFGMRERALYAGGRVEVESDPGRGTRVHIRIEGSQGAPGRAPLYRNVTPVTARPGDE